MKKPAIVIRTPQFDRSPREPGPAGAPSDLAAWDALWTCTAGELRALGLRPFGTFEEPGGHPDLGEYNRLFAVRREVVVRPAAADRDMLWLLPAEWYGSIPEGTRLVDIFFCEEVFRRGESDDDRRFGCLPYGVYGPRERP